MQMKLRTARIEAGLLQTDMASALNVDRKTISAWENGKSMPKADKIDAICSLLGRTYDEIKWKA